MYESRKILELNDLMISAFAVRVPVINSHAEAVWAEFENEVSEEDIVSQLNKQEGLIYMPNDAIEKFPDQHYVSGKNSVFIGRLHQDLFNKNKWIFT